MWKEAGGQGAERQLQWEPGREVAHDMSPPAGAGPRGRQGWRQGERKGPRDPGRGARQEVQVTKISEKQERESRRRREGWRDHQA